MSLTPQYGPCVLPKYWFKSYTRKRSRKLGATALTLALSIQTPEGVVLCAETQITEGQSKFNEPKISSMIHTPDLTFAIVGAGWWDYVKMAYEELQRSILDAAPDTDILDTVKAVITGLYDNQIKAYPSEFEKPRISLLTAIWKKASHWQ